MSAVWSPSAVLTSRNARGTYCRRSGSALSVEPRDVRRRTQREFHLNAVVFVETIFLPQTFGGDENVAEQNRRVETEPPDRLERDFGGEFGRLHQFEKGMFLPERAIFRQRAPGLAHEPDGRTIHGLARTGVEETPAAGQRSGGGPGRFGGSSGCLHFDPVVLAHRAGFEQTRF